MTIDMKLDIRPRDVTIRELTNAVGEAQWLRDQSTPHAPASIQALIVTVDVGGTTVGGGLGCAREIAVTSVTPDGKLSQWQVEGVGWDVWHGQGPHGSHHGRIVSFIRGNQVSVMVSSYAGPPMVCILLRLGILSVFGAGGDAQDAVRSAAVEYREVLARPAG